MLSPNGLETISPFGVMIKSLKKGKRKIQKKTESDFKRNERRPTLA